MREPSTRTSGSAFTGPVSLPLATRLADYSVISLAVVFGLGSIVLFAWPGQPVFVPMGLSSSAALWWNALLSFVFFVQHSGMVRRPFRARLSAIIPERYDGAFYAMTSGIALALVAVLLQPSGEPLFRLEGLPRLAVSAAALLAILAFAWGIRTLRTFDLLGLRPIREHLRPGPTRPAGGDANALVVRGPYRWVRHPLYSCVIVLLWADPALTPGRLMLAALWTAWIYVGARLEERDLSAEFGDRYREYQRQVPILIPWRGRVAVDSEAHVRQQASL
jgi:protein-S-isoprenylcysteine O-methyltransferase Ste14